MDENDENDDDDNDQNRGWWCGSSKGGENHDFDSLYFVLFPAKSRERRHAHLPEV